MSQNEIYTYHLPNGLTLVAEPIGGIRSAAFQLLIPAGAATDPAGQEGVSTVLEGLSYRGAGGRAGGHSPKFKPEHAARPEPAKLISSHGEAGGKKR